MSGISLPSSLRVKCTKKGGKIKSSGSEFKLSHILNDFLCHGTAFKNSTRLDVLQFILMVILIIASIRFYIC